MANQAKILMFHIEPKKAAQIEGICRSLKLKPVKIKPAAYGQKLGYLAGITGFTRENIPCQSVEFPSEMLVFSGMDSQRVDRFLSQYKETGIAPVSLKAVLTPHNISWSAEELYRELFREHMKLHGI
ncbi:MAG: DUF3783 domain-containing protein [Bacteroidales bacterium]|nr:DUF3783 domain-containing protein [Clostridium sp.]MCM1204226.1 DUF3783 domain-containing protein [Bacteroidales bacterium]